MRLAILSDIHANLEALEAVIAAGEQQKVDAWVCLGDIVGYGADPGPCVERLRDLEPLAVVRGNHDDMAGRGQVDPYTTPRAAQAIAWTREHLTGEQLTWLAELPMTHRLDDRVLLVHASPLEPEAWHYVVDARDAGPDLAAQSVPLCFFGHTHRPLAVREGAGGLPFAPDAPIPLERTGVYLINIGSVGQPRDGDPRASFGILDRDRQVVELHRVTYDIPAAQDKIRAAGLPPSLADRLAEGY